jgi:hypothetical protein
MATWYAETYHFNGTEELGQDLPDFASVRRLILDARRAGFHDVIRVLAPNDASTNEVQQLRDLGIEFL